MAVSAEVSVLRLQTLLTSSSSCRGHSSGYCFREDLGGQGLGRVWVGGGVC